MGAFSRRVINIKDDKPAEANLIYKCNDDRSSNASSSRHLSYAGTQLRRDHSNKRSMQLDFLCHLK